MNINLDEYRKKVSGCWLGKNIGGTIGAPFEWRRQVNDVSFYTQDLGGEPLPNDDLDIQLLWLIALEEQGADIDSHVLSEYWSMFVTPHWSEYGNAKVNMRTGLLPPWSGTYQNDYKDSCGAFIRSEIWACIAPGAPQIAARYAYEDAVIDHGDGEGTFAEVFCAALESAAFVSADLGVLTGIGLSYIPAECGVAKAVRLAVECCKNGKTWLEARDEMLEKYRGSTFFGMHDSTCEADRKKGFAEGKQGWDAPSNIGMMMIALLYGDGDFDKTVCMAVNCGEDTDCTAATAGSIFGLMHGIGAIPEKWVKPIGYKIKTACLNLGELGYFGNQLPQTIQDLSKRTEAIALQVLARSWPRVTLSDDGPTSLPESGIAGLTAKDWRVPGWATVNMAVGEPPRYENLHATVYSFDFFNIAVDYPEGIEARSGEKRTVTLRIDNRYKLQVRLSVHWYLPEGWSVSPGADSFITVPARHMTHGKLCEASFVLETDRIRQPANRFVVECTIAGRSMVMLVPVMLLAGR